jgi:hypothetical protein
MSQLTHLSCILASCFIASHIHTSEPPIVVACDFNAISQNAGTGDIISQAVTSARHILSCFYWSYITPWSLYSTIAHMQQRGTEIAKITPGITNTIKKLFTELEEQQYGKFTDTAITCFNEMGVNPVPDTDALSLLSKIKEYKIPAIGIGNQDSAEHEIYARKMLSDHNIPVHRLFDGIVTIPTLEEQASFEFGSGDCFLRNAHNPRWLVARETYPSTSFSQTIKILARDIASTTRVWSVDKKEQLAAIVNALQLMHEQRAASTSSDKMFDELMEQDRAISPTRV